MNNNNKEFHPVTQLIIFIVGTLLGFILLLFPVSFIAAMIWGILALVLGISITFKTVLGVLIIIVLLLSLIK